MDRIALTSSGPYTGCSTLAAHMEVFGNYTHVNMSEVLIEAFEEDQELLPGTVSQDKAFYRKALQEFGNRSGFQSDPRWIDRCLVGDDKIRPIVIEKVRTNAQALTLIDRGFTVVSLAVYSETRYRRAAQFGVTREQLDDVMKHPCEQGIDPHLIKVMLYGDVPVGMNMKFLQALTN